MERSTLYAPNGLMLGPSTLSPGFAPLVLIPVMGTLDVGWEELSDGKAYCAKCSKPMEGEAAYIYLLVLAKSPGKHIMLLHLFPGLFARSVWCEWNKNSHCTNISVVNTMSNRDVALGFYRNPANKAGKRMRLQYPKPWIGGLSSTSRSAQSLEMGGTPGGTVSFDNASLPQAGDMIVAQSDSQAEWRDLGLRQSVRLASIDNVDISMLAPGDMFDGQVLGTGDRILLKDQLDPLENGIYVVGVGSPGPGLARSYDFADGSSAGGVFVVVREGSMENQSNIYVVRQSMPDDVVGADGITFRAVRQIGIGGSPAPTGPIATYSMLLLDVVAKNITWKPVANQEWFTSYASDYTNGKLIITASNVNMSNALMVRLLFNNTTDVLLGSIVMISSPDTYELDMDNTVLASLTMNGTITLQVQRVASMSNHPTLHGASLKFSVIG